MEKEGIKNYFVLNGELTSTKNMEIFGEIKNPIYEVIRVIEGVPLFLEEHLERMKESANIVYSKIDRKEEEIRKDIKKLIIENQVDNLNIKLLFSDIGGKGKVFLVYFIESYYPEKTIYQEGIHTTLYNFERKNPNAKILNSSFKEKVSRKTKSKNAFEALLVNKDGYITEGSRSNIFFVKGSEVYTSPGGEVLLGVTRNHIVEICEKLNLKLIEENIHVEDLYKIDGGFMTGTSVNVLPITSIDEFNYESTSDSVINKIGNSYLKEIQEYIKINKNFLAN